MATVLEQSVSWTKIKPEIMTLLSLLCHLNLIEFYPLVRGKKYTNYKSKKHDLLS